MNRPVILALGLTILLWTGCASSKKDFSGATNAPQALPAKTNKRFSMLEPLSKILHILPKKKSQPPPAILPQWVGIIRMVNTAERFVLLESNSISTIMPGETYVAVSKKNETASLRMTSLKNPPFVIADIMSGTPSVGEKIYLPKPSSPNANAAAMHDPAPDPVSMPLRQ